LRCSVTKQLMRGSHVIGEAATRAGCRFYAGYPITPQNEVPEFIAGRFAKLEGATFIQAESELAAINMVMGASMTGTRAMTSSSSPGISLKQEGISYLAGMELPAVVANIMRGGPGLGNIAPSQADYFQATRGGGHGGYRTIVLAPYSGQELVTLTMKAFDLADAYRMPVILLGDGLMGQMMEPVTFPDPIDPATLPKKEWALSGAKGRHGRLIASLLLDPIKLEQHNWKLARKYETIQRQEPAHESYLLDDAKIAVVAFGTAARIAKGAIDRVRQSGIQAGLFRPITLWPFPEKAIQAVTDTIKHLLVFEMNTGQMVEDVRMSAGARATVHFHGRPGGIISTPREVTDVMTRLVNRHGLR
jgi:2-oxoglutarate ferredoxin oxidoreductase subunit alpha